MFVVSAIAVITAACVADMQTRDQIARLRARDCTVFCTTTGPDFVRSVFVPNLGRSIALVVLQRDDLTRDPMGAGLPVILPKIDEHLMSLLKDVKAKIYGTSEQALAIQQLNNKLTLISFEDAYALVGERQVLACGQNHTLLTSASHLFCTTFLVFAVFSAVGLAASSKRGILAG